MTEEFVELPVDRLIEFTVHLGMDFDGRVTLPEVSGARVKPVIFIPAERVDLLDRVGLVADLKSKGATAVKAPVVHVVRSVERRDERHDVDLPLEESLRLFAEETGVTDPGRIEMALKLAREADAE